MSYSVSQPCGGCKKEPNCADGYIIRGAVQGIIHSMPGPWAPNPGLHLGSGSIVHNCSNFEDKNAPVNEAAPPGTPLSQ